MQLRVFARLRVTKLDRAMLAGVGPGLTFVCLHCSAPGEVELIEPDSAYLRTEEYAVVRSAGFREWLAGQGLEVIGMRRPLHMMTWRSLLSASALI